MKKVQAIAWSPNSRKLAVANSDRVILLYDESGALRDKIPTRALDGKSRNYVIRALDFSPDSTMLSVAQSDNVVYVYNIGADFGMQKTVCNRYTASSSVTCQCWPGKKLNEMYYGLSDGKIKVGYIKGNKTELIRKTESYVVSMAASYDSNFILTGHYDNSVYMYNL
jgi:intraflagellar transport protein 172